METIKIGRKEYEIKQGDYILWNGAIYLFCGGNNRVLKHEGFNHYSHLAIPKSTMKTINLSNMIAVAKSDGCVYCYPTLQGESK